jgi:hypothetical protein
MDVPAMRKLAALAAAVLIAAIGFAAEAGQLVSAQFRSPALGRDWVYDVYLPDGYCWRSHYKATNRPDAMHYG